MKTIICKPILVAAALLAIASIGQAGPNLVLPKNYDTVVTSKAQAEKLPMGCHVAISCPDCKTLVEKKVDDKKSFLSWFKSDEKHDCPGCHGMVTFKGNSKSTPATEHTHVCSKCGNNSAFTCAGHVK